MVFNYRLHAFGATITDFDTVSVVDLVEAVVSRKILNKQILKIFTNFCGFIFTER